jgi:hypothetical protein
MEVREHFYSDDPSRGPEDARTTLPGVSYYFLGNGFIQAAVQVASGKKGTPLGLLIMDPEKFGPKSGALSFDSARGLEPTAITLSLAGKTLVPRPRRVRARWIEYRGLPAVRVDWKGPSLQVGEEFYCPDRRTPRLVREVTVHNLGRQSIRGRLRTGAGDEIPTRDFALAGKRRKRFWLEYSLFGREGARKVTAAWRSRPHLSAEAKRYFRKTNRFELPSPLLDHFYRASLFELQANISAAGKLDGGIWQYNREWTRDQSMAAIALTLSGQFNLARTMLDRLFSRFVTASGQTIDSSEVRAAEECELDQNGVLLWALETYTLWTDDRTLLEKHWKKISAAAEFPLQDGFRQPSSGLLHNRREFWERHSAHGIEDGFELAHQVWVSLGLAAASRLAFLMGKKRESERWRQAARKLKKAVLADERFALIRSAAFIKRRKLNGDIQEELHPSPASGLPGRVPLFARGRHFLNPDTSTVLPLAWEFVPPRSKLARNTLAQVERLWNQRWKGGGYGRYDVSSEPDSPGPWPFPSLFVARAYFEAGRDARVWRVFRWLSRLPGGQAGSWSEFYGPRPVPPYPQVGIVPWTWSELIIFFIRHLAGIRPEHRQLRLRPRLLSKLAWYRVKFRLRNLRVDLEVRPASRRYRPGFRVGGKLRPYGEDGLTLPYSRKEIRILARIPFPSGKTRS